MAKMSNPPNPCRYLVKYMPSEDTKTIALVKYSYGLTTDSMDFGEIGFCLTPLLNFAISVELYTTSAEVYLFFFPPFFLPYRYTHSNLECFLICILNLSHNSNDLVYLSFMMRKS